MNFHSALFLSLLAVPFVVGCGGPKIPPSVQANTVAVGEIRAALKEAGGGAAAAVSKQPEFSNQFATLRGTITLNGTAPANPVLQVNKDQAVCKPGGKQVTNDIVVTGNGNGLANVLVYADVPDSWVHESQKGNTDAVDYDQKNCLFTNRIVGIEKTQSLRLLNSDSVGHNAALKPAKNASYDATIPGGGEAVYPEPGGKALVSEKIPFTVSCAAHPWMQSYIIIRDNGYFAVTDQDGSFELKNLPAGVPVKIMVWHEVTKGVSVKSVTVQPEGIAQKWSKRGAFTVNLEADSQADLKIAINGDAFTK